MASADSNSTRHRLESLRRGNKRGEAKALCRKGPPFTGARAFFKALTVLDNNFIKPVAMIALKTKS